MLWRLAVLTLLATQIFADDWPQWRGPARNGISKEKGWLDHWPDQGPPIAWKASVGLGFSAFAVANDKAITAGHNDGKDTVFCFDAATGKEIWKQSYASDLGDKFFEGGVTGSATIDGENVYWLSRWGDLFCLELASGKIAWQRKIETKIPTWGFTGAPTVLADKLILNIGEAGMAVEKKSGKDIWTSADKEAGYSTPLPIDRDGKTQIWLGSGTAYVAIDAATGKEIWRMKWLTQYGVNAADPIPFEDKVFISTGYGKGAALIKPAAGADPETIWKSKVLRTQRGPGVLIDKYIYGVDGDTTDKCSLKCIEAATGAEKWNFPDFGPGALIVADGKIVAISGTGELIVGAASPDAFKPTARAQVLGGKCWTVPTLANGLIYCRNSRGDVAVVDTRAK